MDLLAHRLHHLVDAVGDAAVAVAVAAGHADETAGTAHGRTQKAAGVERVAHGEFDIVLAAAVTHGGDAAFQRVAHELHAAHRELRRRQALLSRAGVALATKKRVDVAVDDARDQRAAGGVDLLAGEARELSRGRDALDLAALLQHRVPILHLFAVEQTTADIQRGH